jgi:hypothetical protein
MPLGERRPRLRAIVVLSLAAVLVTCLGPGSILAAPAPAAPLAKSKNPDGQVFAGWHDACEGNGAGPCTRTLTGPTSVDADFFAYDPGGPPT